MCLCSQCIDTDAKVWPLNRNHEAARRHVNQILRNHGRPDYSRRETEIAQLLDDLVQERDELRGALPSRDSDLTKEADHG